MKRYIMRRKWLFLLTLGVIALWNLIGANITIAEQRMVDAVLALDGENIPRLMLGVIAINSLSGLFYVASQLLKNAFQVTITDDMRKSVFAGVMKRSRKDFFSVNYFNFITIKGS